MKICPKCKSLMRLERKEDKIYFICPKCGYLEEFKNPTITTKVEKEDKVTVLQKDITAETIVRVKCPKCGNDKAYTWIAQTRSGDEGPTVFYRCTKCGHTWRIYT